MRIAYRRMSGKIGLSSFEQGTRGMWWEKRKALLKTLRIRGHHVDIVTPLTSLSGAGMGMPYDPKEHELLMIEFGSSNTNFYGSALHETAAMYRRHKGPIVFLCDDPDLPFHAWGERRRKGCFQWLNCVLPAPLKSPDWVTNLDMPFSALQEPATETRVSVGDRLVYIGRPNGRTRAFKDLLAAGVPFAVYANPKEWTGFDVEVLPPPAQVDRAAFYGEQLGCLAISDAKHKRYGWRTGRAYHAALAGCPVLIEAGQPGMEDFTEFQSPDAVFRAIELFRTERARIQKLQLNFLVHDRVIAEETFVRCGL